MIDILDAARYLIFLSYGEKRYSLTPLKIQKILYLAQGWSYVWDGVPAYPDRFVAWQSGPVNEKVYEAFKQYGRGEIPEWEGLSKLMDRDVEETLDAVWLEYGKISAYDLVELTHKQDPWKYAYTDNREISNENIRKYFQSTFLSINE